MIRSHSEMNTSNYLCSLWTELLLGLEPPPGNSCEVGAVSFSAFSKLVIFCSCFSRAICSSCSFNSLLCCVMICCWVACRCSNLLPGDAALFKEVKPLPSPLCRASWSSAAVSATCLRVTCHGWVGSATEPTGALSWCAAEVSGVKVPDLWWSS